MKKISLGLICFFQIITLLGAAQKKIDYIVFYKPFTDTLETNHYILDSIIFDFNTQYKNIIEANIKNDLAEAAKHFDFRFIAISGNSYLWPGLMGYTTNKKGEKNYGVLKEYEKLLSNYNFKVIYGTSDVYYSNQPDLQSAAANYAEKYNKMLLEKLGYITDKPH